MEGKKISFGFMKTKKQDKPVISDKKEYIDCVEEMAIKVVGGEVSEEIKPLVIPMKPNTLITAEKLKEIAEKVENFDEPDVKSEKEEQMVPENETLDQMAVRELMEEGKKIKIVETEKLVVPINVKPVMDGQAEATLDDYESVPVQDFGLAMLRGMGWVPGKDQSKYKQPQLRPKGLGLGADKVIKENEKSKSSKDKDEELSIVKNSFVKITTGKFNGLYGKVVSLDEDNGRAMVDITVKKETVNLSEFMMQPVTKAEFDKQSKVINTESYEEYKKKEMLKTCKDYSTKTDDDRKQGSSSRRSNDIRDKEYSGTKKRSEDAHKNDDKHSNGRNKSKEREKYKKECSSSEEERIHRRKKNKKKYSSNESLSSESDSRHKPIHRRRHSTSDSSESNYRKKEKTHKSKSKEKRDIDKKRKGKKKRRDRDRSPNYKKHRK